MRHVAYVLMIFLTPIISNAGVSRANMALASRASHGATHWKIW